MALILQASSIVAIALLGLGFGMTLAYEAWFDIAPVSWIESAAQLPLLVTTPVAAVIQGSVKALASADEHWWIFAAIGICAAAVVWLATYEPYIARAVSRTANRTKLWCSKHPRYARALLAGFLGATIGLLSWALVRLAFALIAVLVVTAVIGYFAGKRELYESIIKPPACIPLEPRTDTIRAYERAKQKAKQEPEQAPAERRALCVAVKSVATGVLEQGRVVLRTRNQLHLYDPCTGRTWSEPIESVRIEKVAAIPACRAP